MESTRWDSHPSPTSHPEIPLVRSLSSPPPHPFLYSDRSTQYVNRGSTRLGLTYLSQYSSRESLLYSRCGLASLSDLVQRPSFTISQYRFHACSICMSFPLAMLRSERSNLFWRHLSTFQAGCRAEISCCLWLCTSKHLRLIPLVQQHRGSAFLCCLPSCIMTTDLTCVPYSRSPTSQSYMSLLAYYGTSRAFQE